MSGGIGVVGAAFAALPWPWQQPLPLLFSAPQSLVPSAQAGVLDVEGKGGMSALLSSLQTMTLGPGGEAPHKTPTPN